MLYFEVYFRLIVLLLVFSSCLSFSSLNSVQNRLLTEMDRSNLADLNKTASDSCGGPISPSNAISFMRIVGQLKTLKRTGWVDNKVNLPESVADHMYRYGNLLKFNVRHQS